MVFYQNALASRVLMLQPCDKHGVGFNVISALASLSTPVTHFCRNATY